MKHEGENKVLGKIGNSRERARRRPVLRLAVVFSLLAAFAPTAKMTAATLPVGFVETQIGSAFNGTPTAMALAPDGRIFVCLQGGQLRVVKNDTLLATPFISLTVDSSGERGLLGVAFDPSFATNNFVYLYYTVPGSPAHNRVSRFTANGDVVVAGSEVVLLDLNNLSSATNHNGGAIHFGPDGKLYVAAGENANSSNSQSLGNLLGKILRINSDGTIPSDNPFFNTATGNNRAIWVLGLRNPFTFDFQPGTSRMFINDVGQSTWEEINDGIAGSNYGWPITEGPTTDPRFRSPLLAYGHGSAADTGCAITGGTFYNPFANQFPASYLGKYFYADFCSGWIRLFDPSTGNSSSFATGIANPVDLHVGSDGSLYYLAQGGQGQLFRIRALAAQPQNLSSRGQVLTGDNVMIGGFIVTGSAAKDVVIRALGPSLQAKNVPGPLADPILELHGANGALITTNDNWKDTQQAAIQNANLAPADDLESAIAATLQPGSYTAIVRGKNNGTGIGLVEVYDLDTTVSSKLANLSARSFVETAEKVLIGGFIIGGNNGASKVIVRAIGPSLNQAGLNNVLADPTLEVRDNNGTLLLSNDNWQDDPAQAAQITAAGVAPSNVLESALPAALLPGSYTAIVAGKNGGTGIALVEIYNVP